MPGGRVLFLLVILLALTLFACQEGEKGEIVELRVAPDTAICPGLAPMELLVVNGECFYGDIEGFGFEPGIEWLLKVRKTAKPEEEFATDIPAHRWELLEILDRKRLTEGIQ